MKSKALLLLFSLICISNFSIAQFIGTSPIQQASSGNVAIGFPTYTPSSLLQVRNGTVLFDGGIGITPVNGAGIRMMWIPAKSAFRAGQITGGAFWDDINIGTHSAAFGINTKASGSRSFAAGNTTIASAANSSAFGSTTTATGSASFATGSNTIASGELSASFGNNTIAQSNNSFVIGRFNYNPGHYTPGTWIATEPLFVIGNGSSATATSNAMTVLKNGNVGLGQVSPPSKLSIQSGLTKANSFSVNNMDVHTTIFNQTTTNAGVIQVYSGGSASTIGASAYVLQLQPEGGNVGIGVSSRNPSERFEVNGTVSVNGNAIYLQTLDHNHGLGYFNTFTTTGEYANKSIDGPVLFGYSGGALGINQGTNRTIALSWNANGQVGIGSPLTDPTSASYKLLVNGDIRAKKVVVETGWSDFVFEKGYKLRTLEEVEKYIKQNGHLPEIPSAKEVERNGGDLGYLVKLQMQKIEELTLYIIEQQKQIDEIKMRLK